MPVPKSSKFSWVSQKAPKSSQTLKRTYDTYAGGGVGKKCVKTKASNPAPVTTGGRIQLRYVKRARAFVLCMIAPCTTLGGPAIGQFEMKDLEVEPGEVEFQSQNAHSFDHPERRVVDDAGELEFDDNEHNRQRHALEIEVGVNSFMRSRIGIEFEKERFDDPPGRAQANDFDALKLTEVAFETVAVMIPPQAGRPGLGFLTEVEVPLSGDDESHTVIFGPIAQYARGSWRALADVYTVYHYGGGEDDGKWDLQYALQLHYRPTPRWTYAVEAYGTVDRLGRSGTRNEAARLFGDHDQHRIGPIVYYTWHSKWSPWGAGRLDRDAKVSEEGEGFASALRIGLGWFVGLTDDTPDHTLKWSLEYDF